MKHGVIISAHEITSCEDNISIHAGIRPENLRYYLTYWDKLLIVDSNLIGVNLKGELDILRQAGVLEKQTATLQQKNDVTVETLVEMHFGALADVATSVINDQCKSEQWVIHQNGDHFIVPKNKTKEMITADICLNNCLPSPTSDLPIQELLEFKLKRKDELHALRACLDELYLNIISSRDLPRAKNHYVQRLESAIVDLNAVAKNSWGNHILATRKVSIDFNYNSLSDGLLAGAVIGKQFSSPIAGVVLGSLYGIVKSLKIEVTLSKQLESIQGNKIDLSYLSSIKNNNIA